MDKDISGYGFAVVFLTLLYLSLGAAENGTVYLKDGKFTFKPGMIKKGGLAYGTYDKSYSTIGWDVLNIKAGYWAMKGVKQRREDVMYAAGYLEGYMTAKKISQHWANIKALYSKTKTSNWWDTLKKITTEQERWSIDKVTNDEGKTPFWRQISYTLARFDGLFNGYKVASNKDKSLPALSRFAFSFLNSLQDVENLYYGSNKTARPHTERLTEEEFLINIYHLGHCSALIKATPGFENVFIGHSTWVWYSFMLRMYKHYDFNIDDPDYVNKQISFSGYPGIMGSENDFYLISNGLVVTETTNQIYNNSLYDLLKPQSLLAYQTVLAANALASDGKAWAEIFKARSSGTHFNQYMVLDLKKIIPRKEIQDGALWVIEQVPGLVEAKDQTRLLREGYWASYNVPFYDSISNISGFSNMIKRRGEMYSHALSPRAEIFRRDAGKVNSMQGIKDILRYNDYKKDKYSQGNACETICCRGDLTREHAQFGCTDSKVTDFNMAWRRESQAICGPTTGQNHSLPPFSWKNFTQPQLHEGQPETFEFDWVEMKPSPNN